MASMKAEKSVGTSLFGQAKKEPAKTDGPSKGPGSKSTTKKAAPKTQDAPKKKGKGGKSAAKH